MANQFRITGYSVTAAGIVLTVDFKRSSDGDALPNSTENIVYPSGSTKADILANLQGRAMSKITSYENDLVVQSTVENNMNKWINVPEPIPV